MRDPALTRRRFLSLLGGAAVAGVAAACAPGGSDAAAPGTAPSVGASAAGRSVRPTGRTLVVVQLAGGLDVLSAVVPVTDGRYHDARPTLAVDESSVVALAGRDDLGLHPALAPLATHYEAGALAVVEGVGLPGQSRSHFQALDAMWAATAAEARTTGWLGRWLDVTAEGDQPLRAVSLGTGAPAMVGDQSLPTVVLDPAAFDWAPPAGADERAYLDALDALAPSQPAGDWLGAAQAAIPAAAEAVEVLAAAGAAEVGGRRRGHGRGAVDTAGLFDVAAELIDLELGTELILVGLSGFDTHAGQAATLDRLLGELATGLDGLLTAVTEQGRAEDVVVLVQSEFGRRVAENGDGTDHGTGGMALLAGAPVAGGAVVGEADLDGLVEGDLPIVVDTRSVYADVLDWLGGPTPEVLGTDPERLGLLPV